MLPGGCDLVFLCPAGTDVEGYLLAACHDAWPHAVVRSAGWEEGRTEPLARSTPLPAPGPEFFVFRSREDAGAWDTYGAGGDRDDAMIHLIVRPSGRHLEATIVHAGEGAVTGRIARDVRRACRGGRE